MVLVTRLGVSFTPSSHNFPGKMAAIRVDDHEPHYFKERLRGAAGDALLAELSGANIIKSRGYRFPYEVPIETSVPVCDLAELINQSIAVVGPRVVPPAVMP